MSVIFFVATFIEMLIPLFILLSLKRKTRRRNFKASFHNFIRCLYCPVKVENDLFSLHFYLYMVVLV